MKQTFSIPEGCDKVTFEQIGNQIVTTFEPKFKNGDIVTLQYGNRDYISYACIYSDKKCWTGINSRGELVIDGISNDDDANVKLNIANDLQRKLLFSKLKEKGYKYNEDTCELEKIRWEPKVKESFDYIAPNGTVDNMLRLGFTVDKTMIELGNCFKPGTLDQDKVKRLFAEFIEKVREEHCIND